MADRCLRCRKKVNSDDFLCPNCGAILGDPISYAKIAGAKEPIKGKLSLRVIVAAVTAMVLLALVVGAAWVLYPYIRENFHLGAGIPNQPVPEATQSTAPLAVYTVSVKTENKTKLTGTCIHIMQGETELYSSRIREDGVATFVLPQSDDYSIRFTDLPFQYEYHYKDAVYSFEPGTDSLAVVLVEKPVPYSIKILNSAGEPLPGTGLIFYRSSQGAQFGVTDENGICEFLTNYGVGSCSVKVTFAPNGYVSGDYFTFVSDKLDFTFELQSFQEMGVAEQEIFTVRVVDEYGAPVTNQAIVATSSGGSLGTNTSMGYTNMDGCYMFIAAEEIGYTRHVVKIQNNPDYFETEFEFEPGSNELVIQLDLHKDSGEEYAYKVRFVDQFGDPVPGVTISVSVTNQSLQKSYTSDEDGMITFFEQESDPTLISFTVVSCPSLYSTEETSDTRYSFNKNGRMLQMTLTYKGRTDFTVRVLDDQGNPVPGVELWISQSIIGTTDENGICIFHLFANQYYQISVTRYPPSHNNYMISMSGSLGPNAKEVLIIIKPKPQNRPIDQTTTTS